MIFTPRDLAEPWNPTIKIGPQTLNLVLAISSSKPFSRWVFVDIGLVGPFNSRWEDQCVSVQTRKCIWPLVKSTKTIVAILYSQPSLRCAFQAIEWSQGALWTPAFMFLFQDGGRQRDWSSTSSHVWGASCNAPALHWLPWASVQWGPTIKSPFFPYWI